jgi:pilus assembly protein CpaB
MNRRALLIALLVSMFGVALLVLYLRRFEEEASGGGPVKVLTALKPIGAGQVLTDDVIATRIIPRAYVEDRAVLEAERPKIIGLKVGHALQTQQGIMWSDLAIASDERRNLSSLVQPGNRAVMVRAAVDEQASELIRPGDRIDVIATMSDPKGAAASETRTAVVLLQNVLVLAVGGDTGSELKEKGSGRTGDLMLSLSLNIPEAQLLTLAVERGKLTVALRNPDDARVTDGISDISSSALSDSKARVQVQSIRRTSPAKVE